MLHNNYHTHIVEDNVMHCDIMTHCSDGCNALRYKAQSVHFGTENGIFSTKGHIGAAASAAYRGF